MKTTFRTLLEPKINAEGELHLTKDEVNAILELSDVIEEYYNSVKKFKSDFRSFFELESK